MIDIKVKCSPEQEDLIAMHAMDNQKLRIQADERAWIVAGARKQVPGCVVKAADLDIENGTWLVTID